MPTTSVISYALPPMDRVSMEDDWTKIRDPKIKKRLQNRIAQREHRRRIRDRLGELEAAVGEAAVGRQGRTQAQSLQLEQLEQHAAQHGQYAIQHPMPLQQSDSTGDVSTAESYASCDVQTVQQQEAESLAPISAMPASEEFQQQSESDNEQSPMAAQSFPPESYRLVPEPPSAYSHGRYTTHSVMLPSSFTGRDAGLYPSSVMEQQHLANSRAWPADVSMPMNDFTVDDLDAPAAVHTPPVTPAITLRRTLSTSVTGRPSTAGSYSGAEPQTLTGSYTGEKRNFGTTGNSRFQDLPVPASNDGDVVSQPATELREARFDFLSEWVEFAGFQHFDDLAASYYTASFEEGSSLHQEQRMSRRRGLPLVLSKIRQEITAWQICDKRSFQEEILTFAEDILSQEYKVWEQSSELSLLHSGTLGLEELKRCLPALLPSMWTLMSAVGRNRSNSDSVAAALITLCCGNGTTPVL